MPQSNPSDPATVQTEAFALLVRKIAEIRKLLENGTIDMKEAMSRLEKVKKNYFET